MASTYFVSHDPFLTDALNFIVLHVVLVKLQLEGCNSVRANCAGCRRQPDQQGMSGLSSMAAIVNQFAVAIFHLQNRQGGPRWNRLFMYLWKQNVSKFKKDGKMDKYGLFRIAFQYLA